MVGKHPTQTILPGDGSQKPLSWGQRNQTAAELSSPLLAFSACLVPQGVSCRGRVHPRTPICLATWSQTRARPDLARMTSQLFRESSERHWSRSLPTIAVGLSATRAIRIFISAASRGSKGAPTANITCTRASILRDPTASRTGHEGWLPSLLGAPSRAVWNRVGDPRWRVI